MMGRPRLLQRDWTLKARQPSTCHREPERAYTGFSVSTSPATTSGFGPARPLPSIETFSGGGIPLLPEALGGGELSEQSFCGPDRAYRANTFQQEREAESAFHVGAYIELTDFEAHAVAVGVIPNLGDRTLEKRVLHIVRKLECAAEAGLCRISVAHVAAQLIVGNFNRAAAREEIGNPSI